MVILVEAVLAVCWCRFDLEVWPELILLYDLDAVYPVECPDNLDADLVLLCFAWGFGLDSAA